MLEFGSKTLVITHDSMAEGTHWPESADPFDVAWKLVAVNLSDLAAAGAEPIGVLLAYSLDDSDGDGRFIEGLRAVLETYDAPLLGGDTIRADGPRTLGLTAIGRATHTPVPSRSGAKIGDGVFVTGDLGQAMLGHEGIEAHREAFVRPIPLLETGRALAPVATAMMDISDGLLLDATRLAKASKVTLSLENAAIPVADRARFDDCIRWGDDYQLLFTAPSGAKLPIRAHRIGEVTARSDAPTLLDGAPVVGSLGYQH